MIYQGDRELVEVLLAANADPTIKSDKNETAYSMAVASGRQLVALIIAESSVIRKLHAQDGEHSSLLIDR